ncbi:MAG: helix-turn-helix domain-containing protein [Pseudomarimonas sp.]
MALATELIGALKRLLKANGVTYAELARRLSLSEATVKRMFSRQAITLQRLDSICRALDIGLSELSTEAQRRRDPLAELDIQQEQALVEDPSLLLALYLVLNRWQQSEVLARYRWTAVEWTVLLARLDRLGIIELLPGNRTRVLTARNFRWRQEGPMQQYFQRQLLPEYFRSAFAGPEDRLLLLSGMLAPASAALIDRRMAEAAEEFDRLMAQDAALPASARIGVSLVLAKRPWSLRMFANLRNSPQT